MSDFIMPQLIAENPETPVYTRKPPSALNEILKGCVVDQTKTSLAKLLIEQAPAVSYYYELLRMITGSHYLRRYQYSITNPEAGNDTIAIDKVFYNGITCFYLNAKNVFEDMTENKMVRGIFDTEGFLTNNVTRCALFVHTNKMSELVFTGDKANVGAWYDIPESVVDTNGVKYLVRDPNIKKDTALDVLEILAFRNMKAKIQFADIYKVLDAVFVNRIRNEPETPSATSDVFGSHIDFDMNIIGMVF